MIRCVVQCVLAAAFVLHSQEAPTPAKKPVGAKKKPAAAKKKRRAQREEGWHLRWNRRPEIRYSDKLEMDVRFKLQTNVRRLDQEGSDLIDAAEVRRSRGGIEGNFLRDYEYQLEFELDNRQSWLRDAYVNFRRFRALQLQGGQFKIPFGLDQLTSPMNMEFIYRSRVGNVLSPARSQGLMAHGRAAQDAVSWQAGVFRGDGEMSYTRDHEPTAGPSVAGRLVFRPSQVFTLPDALKSFDIGAAATRSRTDGGSLSLRGRTGIDDTFFDHLPIQGNRVRTGVEASWTPGSFGFQAEAVQVREQRLGQSIAGDDLPDLLSRGWYAQAVWVATGDNKTPGRMRVRKPLFQGGWGALELAARREYIGFRSDTQEGLRSRSPRAFNLQRSGMSGWTTGVNWYPTEQTKVQFNFIDNRITPNTGASAIPYKARVFVLSLQVVL